MRNRVSIIVAFILAIVFVLFMMTFQVRYDEVAVLTTFDRADEPVRNADGQIDPDNPGSLRLKPGLYFKTLPWPIQKVETYSKRLHLLEDQLEELQTADGYAIIVRTFVGWRIEDPYAFFRTLKNVPTAEKQLQPLMRDIKGVISAYRFDELVNTDASKLKLSEIEQKCADQLREQLARIQPGYGIQVEQVGIRRLILPEQTTEKVFERMRATRERMAEKARAEGAAEAATIKSEAESAQQIILAFANRKAEEIRSIGRNEAAGYYKVFDQDEDLAIFLDKIRALKNLANNGTFVIESDTFTPFDVLMNGPQQQLQQAQPQTEDAVRASSR